MTTQRFILIAATCVYLVALIATVYFTRATLRRVAGALIGGVAVGVVGVGVETLAHSLGWWRYPSVETPYGPPLMYPALVLLFATLALIGWRVTRRFGWRGQAVFLGALAILGTVRDYQWAARAPELIVFAPGIGTALVDAACWASLAGLAQAVMCWVAGPCHERYNAARGKVGEICLTSNVVASTAGIDSSPRFPSDSCNELNSSRTAAR